MATPSNTNAPAQVRGARKRSRAQDPEPFIDMMNLPQGGHYGGHHQWPIQGQAAAGYPNIPPPKLPSMPPPSNIIPGQHLTAASCYAAGYLSPSPYISPSPEFQPQRPMFTPSIPDVSRPKSVAPGHTHAAYPTPPTPGQQLCAPSPHRPVSNYPSPAGGQSCTPQETVVNPYVRGSTSNQPRPTSRATGPANPSPQPPHLPHPALQTQAASLPSPQAPSTPHLPDGFSSIVQERRRLSHEEKQRAAAEEAKQAREKARQERLAAQQELGRFQWPPNDSTEYPAESVEEVILPRSEYRARAIHMGTPRRDHVGSTGTGTGATRGWLGVYAVRPPHSATIEFRVARDGSSPAAIRRGQLTTWKHIRLNMLFEGMTEAQAERWVRQMLAMVPGQNDSIMKWTRDNTPATQQDGAT
ncbi:hypothetical protein Hte_007698 [Hypoxylon texense]